MSAVITTQTLTMMQNGVGGLRATSSTITRGGSQVSTPLCRVRPDRREIHPVSQEVLAQDQQWIIYFPPGQDVRPLDTVTAAGCLYLVIIVRDPRTYEVSRQTLCYRVLDANGNTPYLRANATVTVNRYVYNSGTEQETLTQVATGVSVYIDDVSTTIKLAGMAPEFDYFLVCDGATDIRDGDQLTGYNGGAGTVPPILVVQNASQHDLAPGWYYRTAEIKALPPGGSD